MRRVDFTESQIADILCEARLRPIDDVAKKHTITAATIYSWRCEFGQLGAEDKKRMRHLKTAMRGVRDLLQKAKIKSVSLLRRLSGDGLEFLDRLKWVTT